IPDRLVIHRVQDDLIAARPNEWPQISPIPTWVLGSTAGAPKAAISLGWSKRGLYVAVNVNDSRGTAPDPTSFWVGDALELFIDTNQPAARQFGPGVHQFWMVPRFETGSVYVGRWKRGGEIGATRYDVPGIRSTARRTPGGYVMECLIPASLMDGFNPTVGARLGLNLNLSVKGITTDREVFWPHSKAEGIADHPDQWGAVTLEP
ncbi:MAG: CBM9 family sugar-binding protein, partial [Chloroflexi bacterium]|nr:CBM9 family sugar-binding protein [Chloroflexota bacterium]